MEDIEEQKKEKLNFFKRFWYSITKIEKYPNMASQGFGKALVYFIILVIIIATVHAMLIVYEIIGVVEYFISYIQSDLPEFSYSNGELKVESENPIEKSSEIAKTIVDTNDLENETVEQYLNSIDEDEMGLIWLKNNVIFKFPTHGEKTLDYRTMFQNYHIDIDNFDKETLMQYANSYEMQLSYLGSFLLAIKVWLPIWIKELFFNFLCISLVGYITSKIVRIKIKKSAIFSMSMYALTLSITLYIAYLIVTNLIIDFYITHFKFMYNAIAVVYIVSAILMIKQETIKRQAELIKISQEQDMIKMEMEDKEQQEKNEKEKEERKKKDKEEESENGEATGESCYFEERKDL